jgi:hypothetical protein
MPHFHNSMLLLITPSFRLKVHLPDRHLPFMAFSPLPVGLGKNA